jgi:hypothetical protein
MTLAASACVAVAWGQDPAPGPTPGTPPAERQFESAKLLDGLTMAELKNLLERAGYAPVVIAGNAGDYYEVVTQDGYKFEVSMGDCSEGAEPRCISLNLRSYAFLETPKVTLKGINAWNLNAWGARGMLFKDGTSGMAMNIGLDGGVTESWVVKRFGNFEYWHTAYRQFVEGTAAP